MGKKENTVIVVNGIKEGKSDDTILQELFETGIPFGELRSVFNDIVKDKGLRLTSKERKEKTAELMEGVEKIETVEEMQKIVGKLVKSLKVTDTKATGSLRTWAKENGIDLPKAPRAASVRKPGFGGHYAKILDFILENRKADKKAVVAFCHTASIPEAYATQAMNVVYFAKIWNGEIEAEAKATEEK